jgi:hypothetical protein
MKFPSTQFSLKTQHYTRRLVLIMSEAHCFQRKHTNRISRIFKKKKIKYIDFFKYSIMLSNKKDCDMLYQYRYQRRYVKTSSKINLTN